jgi:hypothetical protein
MEVNLKMNLQTNQQLNLQTSRPAIFERRPSHAALCSLGLLVSLFCLPVSAQITSSIKPLLLKAMQEGQARTVLEGKVADKFRDQFQRDAPVVATAKVIEDLGIKGCKRLLVNIEMLGVTIKDGTGNNHPAKIAMPVNFCPDGTVPDRSTYAAISRPAVIFPPMTLEEQKALGLIAKPKARETLSTIPANASNTPSAVNSSNTK